VNVASSAGRRVSLRNPAYTVTKAAELSLSRVFADVYAGKGVLVNAVAPGPVASELWVGEGGIAEQTAKRDGKSKDEVLREQAAKVPIGRMGTPEEIAAVIVFLCSERASNVAGAVWAADGGVVPV
jgi:3-oxoacyl-[acyl-carrier protein] reductase